MADENLKNPGEFEKPSGLGASKADEPVIHVIPDRFYGAGAKMKAKEMRVPPSVAPAGPPVPTAAKPEKPLKKFPVAIVIIVVLLLGVAAAAAYFLFFAGQKDVCGDGTCSAAETYESCALDCPAPGPVCGDGKCETPENYANCAQDCAAPKPVCGDGKCEAGEDHKSCPGDCEAPEAVCGDSKCEEDLGETYKDCPEDCMPPEPNQASDTDSDGLTDAEEQLIYKSDLNKSNSDGDSYVDLNEVLNLFDPAKPDPAVLVDNSGISVYESAEFGINLYRPKSWSVREIVAERTVHFTATTGEIFKVMIYDKKPDQSLMDWYLDQPLNGMDGQVESGVNKKGYEQIISANRRTVYVADGATIAVLKYELADQLEIRYRVTLTMMANSLTISSKAAAAVPAEPADTGPALPVSDDAEEQPRE